MASSGEPPRWEEQNALFPKNGSAVNVLRLTTCELTTKPAERQITSESEKAHKSHGATRPPRKCQSPRPWTETADCEIDAMVAHKSTQCGSCTEWAKESPVL